MKRIPECKITDSKGDADPKALQFEFDKKMIPVFNEGRLMGKDTATGKVEALEEYYIASAGITITRGQAAHVANGLETITTKEQLHAVAIEAVQKYSGEAALRLIEGEAA